MHIHLDISRIRGPLEVIKSCYNIPLVQNTKSDSAQARTFKWPFK